VNTTRVYGLSGTDGMHLSRAEVEARRQVADLLTFLRTYVPGFGQARLIQTAATIGVRETRHPRGLATFTERSVVARSAWPDVVATNVQQGLPGEPMHSADGNEGAQGDARERGSAPELVYTYHVPLGAVVPQQVDGLLLAGRAISADESGDRWTRAMPDCLATGQAAGVAAAIAARTPAAPVHATSVAEIQRELRRQGARVDTGVPPAPFLDLPDCAQSVNTTRGARLPTTPVL